MNRFLAAAIIIFAAISITGCVGQNTETSKIPSIDEILPLSENVQEVNGTYPTMAISYKDFEVTRGRIKSTEKVRESGYYCEDDWLVTFEDGAKLAVRGLDCRPNMAGAVNRIVTFGGTHENWGMNIKELTFKKV